MPRSLFSALSAVLLSMAVSACATAPANPQDPLEPLNRAIFGFNETVDKAVTKPVAKAYKAVVPDPIEMMVRNFFSNLGDVVTVVNDLLQFKLVQAISDTGRVVVNSTVGFLGVADVASAIGLAKHDEDFGQTLGYWGIGSGPYLVLPFLGPSTVRDTVGLAADTYSDPLFNQVDHPRTRNQLLLAKYISKRADLLETEKILEEAAIDRYSFVRDAYLQRRRNQIHDGNPPPAKEENDGADPAKEPPQPGPRQDDSGTGPQSLLDQGSIARAIGKTLREDTTPAPQAEATGPSGNPPASPAQEEKTSRPVPVTLKLWLPDSGRVN